MFCPNCKIEISSLFKHAFLKNECPACGSSLMGEDTLRILGEIKDTILVEANIREETADKLAMSLVAKYEIALRDESGSSVKRQDGSVKIYKNKPSESISSRVITAEQIMKEDISDTERDKILEEALKEKFNDISFDNGMIMKEEYDGLDGPDIDVDASMLSRLSGNTLERQANPSPFAEGEINPYAEQKRLESLARQRQNMASGRSKIKRG